MPEGVIMKALSGFYYVSSPSGALECRARGIFRKDGITPLVGDEVVYSRAGDRGVLEKILPRRSAFRRPAVANIDLLIAVASAVNPVTDPFLIDRVAAIALHAGCRVLVCINKTDLDPGDELYTIYRQSELDVLRVSAETGEGIEALRQAIEGQKCVLTGNSGVGKSSILNALCPGLAIRVGEVSQKLGRGRHTTRHVELFDLGRGTFLADTPGFASFEVEQLAEIEKEELQHLFPEFEEYLGGCRFQDCAHLSEPACSILEAVGNGRIHPSRHASYVRLYEQAAQRRPWERPSEARSPAKHP